MAIEALLAEAIDQTYAQVFAPPPVESFARSGSYLLRLCFADAALAEKFRPSFLRSETGAADLHLGFLTSAEADLSRLIPQPPNEYRLTAGDDCFAVWQPGDLPMLHLFDRKSKRALVWLPAGRAPDWFANLPALPIMHAFCANTPWVALHAAAVSHNNQTLVLAGAGRVGKTTAAVACARAGWDYAGDDYVYANTSSGQVEPLYCSARLRGDVVFAFPDLISEGSRATISEGELRHELRLPAQLHKARVKGGSLAAILLPRRSGATFPIFSLARRFDAVSALYTSMTLVQFGWPEVVIKKIALTVGLAPVFFVDTGQNPSSFRKLLRSFWTAYNFSTVLTRWESTRIADEDAD